MDLLTIEHRDFRLSIECPRYDRIWSRAVTNIGAESLTSVYTWSEGVTSVRLNETTELAAGEPSQAVFFDNADYPVWVEFDRSVTGASFGSHLQSVNESFSFRRSILAGFLNYGNDIGKSEIVLVYTKGGARRRFTFGFEVLSSKLNYHEHWSQIIRDVEEEYRMLSLDYMRRTFHGFAPQSEGEKPDLIWWSVFEGEQERFIKACRAIVERPRRRLRGYEVYQRADRLRVVTPALENELAEHRREPGHLYRTEEQIQSNDTQENRFLKYALTEITAKYELLSRRIESLKNSSQELTDAMRARLSSLRRLQRNPFFRTVGRFKGLSQESLVLQRATGYSQVYRTWNVLRRAYSLNDGIYRLQTKDIATLYEIWCFIVVSHIVKERLGLSGSNVEHRNRMEMNGLFTWELGKGEHSSILFKKDGVELAQLVYNPKHTHTENNGMGISELVVPTVPQKPDIVLQLTKDDMEKGMKLTYLFDAKYRIGGRDSDDVDVPPDDAINQMHRYRDAIYYRHSSDEALKREVIGGYILFPGNGQPRRFDRSIEQVNIGAFPLRPGNDPNRALLEEFIERLISSKSTQIIERVIPQKGTFVELPNRVLIGVVKNSRTVSERQFEEGTATLYYTGRRFPSSIALHDLHYFIPYIKGRGIRDVYEVRRVRTISTREAKGEDSAQASDLRLAFELRYSRRLFDDYRKVDTRKMIRFAFVDTTFDRIGEFLVD